MKMELFALALHLQGAPKTRNFEKNQFKNFGQVVNF
jgi:hypothetical protein